MTNQTIKYTATISSVALIILILSGWRATHSTDKAWEDLLDLKLSKWEVFMGVPHTSVDLDGAQKSDDVRKGTPLGLNNDPKNVFSAEMQGGEVVLKITGEIYGGLTTLNSFDNYHFKTYFRWGDKKWEPRLDRKRDNGILYHCQKPHGKFWNVWMSSVEYQVQEGDMGDLYVLGGVSAECPGESYKDEKGKKINTFKPGADLIPIKSRCAQSGLEEEPNGEWNLLEIYTLDSLSLHVANGKLVNVVVNPKMKTDDAVIDISSGFIQIQSEGAECYYKGMKIRPIRRLPKKFLNQLK